MGADAISVSYIPDSDPEALVWMEHFLRVLEPHPLAFGVDARDLPPLAALIGEFRGKLALATCDATRTNAVITRKTIARNAAATTIQRLADSIKANPLTTESDLVALGLTVPDATQAPHAQEQPGRNP